MQFDVGKLLPTLYRDASSEVENLPSFDETAIAINHFQEALFPLSRVQGAASFSDILSFTLIEKTLHQQVEEIAMQCHSLVLQAKEQQRPISTVEESSIKDAFQNLADTYSKDEASVSIGPKLSQLLVLLQRTAPIIIKCSQIFVQEIKPYSEPSPPSPECEKAINSLFDKYSSNGNALQTSSVLPDLNTLPLEDCYKQIAACIIKLVQTACMNKRPLNEVELEGVKNAIMAMKERLGVCLHIKQEQREIDHARELLNKKDEEIKDRLSLFHKCKMEFNDYNYQHYNNTDESISSGYENKIETIFATIEHLQGEFEDAKTKLLLRQANLCYYQKSLDPNDFAKACQEEQLLQYMEHMEILEKNIPCVGSVAVVFLRQEQEKAKGQASSQSSWF